jgi:D-serine deaminase-like pyridoxal phosphate-dependent protein
VTPPHSPTVFPVTNVADIPSPALLIHRERIDENLRRMMAIAGGPARLRPHIKTHKMTEIVRRQLDFGINRAKCATIAEAEMAAAAGVPDVLLALQPVGPNVGRLMTLRSTFRGTHFSALVDDLDAVRNIGSQVKGPPVEL